MNSNSQNNIKQDDYLPCSFYNGKTHSEDGIYNFEKDGKFYFSFMENGRVILRSEGYKNEAGRENGILSILKNKENENLYKVLRLDDGSWVIVLEALNHQEIARSCSFSSEAEVRELLPGARAKAREELLLQTSLPVVSNADILEDDYLVCGQYEERIHEISDVHKNFISFKHPATEKYYFAWVSADNQIILRSEGYQSTAARDNGLTSVISNAGIIERFKIEEKRGLYYLILTAGNQQEIGRSCPKKTEAELWAMVKTKIEKPVVVASMPVGSVIKNIDKEDDYLLCTEYQGHPVSDKINNIAFFKHANGQHYFAVYNNDGSVKLRSEGFITTAERDNELSAVINHLNNSYYYTRIEKAGYEIKILKDNDGKEIGRTCPKKIFVAAAPVVAQVPATGGFKWWWLIPLLLLIPLFFWWNSCNKPEVETPPVTDTAAVTESVVPVSLDTDGDGIIDTEDQCPNVAGIADNLGCPEMILYYQRDEATLSETDKADLDKVVTFLNNHSKVNVILEGHTSTLGEADYNQKLSEKRANNSVEYLVSKGIDAGRLKAVGYGEQFPIGDNSVEEGRAKSRRTVVKVDK